MQRASCFAALLSVGVLLVAAPAVADNLDHPTLTGVALTPGTPISSNLTTSVGFKQYEYTASKDGFVKLEETTKIVHSGDNGGKAWRPYLRVIRADGTAEAWSSNGNQADPNLGHATMIFRVKKGDRLDVIASIALNNDKHGPGADAAFTLTATENQ
jgi:hypothetical protein